MSIEEIIHEAATKIGQKVDVPYDSSEIRAIVRLFEVELQYTQGVIDQEYLIERRKTFNKLWFEQEGNHFLHRFKGIRIEGRH